MQSQAAARQQLGGSLRAAGVRAAGAPRRGAAPLRVAAIAAPEKKEGPVLVNTEVLTSPRGLSKERLELVNSMDKFAEEQVGRRCCVCFCCWLAKQLYAIACGRWRRAGRKPFRLD